MKSTNQQQQNIKQLQSLRLKRPNLRFTSFMDYRVCLLQESLVEHYRRHIFILHRTRSLHIIERLIACQVRHYASVSITNR